MNGRNKQHGFSLIELLVVISIIGLLASIGLPALRGIGQSNAIDAASRQLVDDLAFARQKAISTRSPVYMVFVPPNFFLPAAAWNSQMTTLPLTARRERELLTNMITGQYSSYALYATKTIGDQPGRPIGRYLTEWKSLPDGIFIPPFKFDKSISTNAWGNLTSSTAVRDNLALRPFAQTMEPLPIPTTETKILLSMPYIGFDAQGKLLRKSYNPLYPDEVIPLTRGSIFYARDAKGQLLFAQADFREAPPGNSTDTNSFRYVRVNWMTGRAKVEKKEITN